MIKLTLKEFVTQWPIEDAARYCLEKEYSNREVTYFLKNKGYSDTYINQVISKMDEIFEEEKDYYDNLPSDTLPSDYYYELE